MRLLLSAVAIALLVGCYERPPAPDVDATLPGMLPDVGCFDDPRAHFTACDPLSQVGCARSALRCTFARIDTRLFTSCQPGGSLTEGAACTEEPLALRYPSCPAWFGDHCTRGLHCRDGACRRLCRTNEPFSCGDVGSGACVVDERFDEQLRFGHCLPPR